MGKRKSKKFLDRTEKGLVVGGTVEDFILPQAARGRTIVKVIKKGKKKTKVKAR